MISVCSCSYSELFKLQVNACCWLLLQLSVARDLAVFAGMCRGGVQGYCCRRSEPSSKFPQLKENCCRQQQQWNLCNIVGGIISLVWSPAQSQPGPCTALTPTLPCWGNYKLLDTNIYKENIEKLFSGNIFKYNLLLAAWPRQSGAKHHASSAAVTVLFTATANHLVLALGPTQTSALLVSDIWSQWCSPIIWRTGRGKVEFWSDVIMSACLEWSVGAYNIYLKKALNTNAFTYILSRRHYIINGHFNKFLCQILWCLSAKIHWRVVWFYQRSSKRPIRH